MFTFVGHLSPIRWLYTCILKTFLIIFSGEWQINAIFIAVFALNSNTDSVTGSKIKILRLIKGCKVFNLQLLSCEYNFRQTQTKIPILTQNHLLSKCLCQTLFVCCYYCMYWEITSYLYYNISSSCTQAKSRHILWFQMQLSMLEVWMRKYQRLCYGSAFYKPDQLVRLIENCEKDYHIYI